MLSVNGLVKVTVNFGANPAPGLTFNVLMIAGDSNVISGLQRFRTYDSIEEVAGDFGTTAPEYLAADEYFEQSPQPNQLMIGRWLSAASSGYNEGAILSPAQQILSNWTAITSGGFDIAINGASAETLTALNFSSVTNLNGVASVINGALTGSVCTWTGENFQVTSNTTGAGVAAAGTITMSANPAANDTLTIDSTVITFVASSPVGNQVVIGPNAAATYASLLAFLQASTDSNIDQATYASTASNVITVTFKTVGTAGNSFTLAKSSSAFAVSGADLSGGTQASTVGYATSPASGTDISALLGMTSTLSQGLVSGFAAETPVQCTTALVNMSSAWYGLMFVANTPQSTAQLTAAQSLAVSGFVEALNPTRMYGVTTSDPGSSSSSVMNDIGSLNKAGGYDQTMTQYSSTSPYAIASMFGRMFSVDLTAQNSIINLMYKQQPGVTAENLTTTQAAVLQSKNINVFAEYDNDTSIIQYGVMASGNFIDEIWGLDWFQSAVQTAVYNLLYTAQTKIPQTDAGQNQLVNAVSNICGNTPGGAVWNGLAGPGVWNSSTVFGSLQQGQYLPLGYYIFTPSLNAQSESDRAARIAPPIQVALKLAGAFQSASVLVTVNQ